MKLRHIIIGLGIALIGLQACNQKSTEEGGIVGNWKTSNWVAHYPDVGEDIIDEARKAAMSGTLQFNSDSTFVYEYQPSFESSTTTQVDEGRWSITGANSDTLKMWYTGKSPEPAIFTIENLKPNSVDLRQTPYPDSYELTSYERYTAAD
jgi:hypothetical protein